MIRRTLLAGAAACAAALALAATPASAQVKVGVAGPITGEYATFSKQMTDGADRAVKDINDKRRARPEDRTAEATMPATPSRPCRWPTSSPARA